MAREERDQRVRAHGAGVSHDIWVETPRVPALQAAAKPLPDGAHRRLSRAQGVGLGLLLLSAIIAVAIEPRATFETFHLLFFVGFMGNSMIKLIAACTPRPPSRPSSTTWTAWAC